MTYPVSRFHYANVLMKNQDVCVMDKAFWILLFSITHFFARDGFITGRFAKICSYSSLAYALLSHGPWINQNYKLFFFACSYCQLAYLKPNSSTAVWKIFSRVIKLLICFKFNSEDIYPESFFLLNELNSNVYFLSKLTVVHGTSSENFYLVIYELRLKLLRISLCILLFPILLIFNVYSLSILWMSSLDGIFHDYILAKEGQLFLMQEMPAALLPSWKSCLLELNIYACVLQMSGLRMKVAGRFKPCVHMGCFDLEVFVEMNQRSRKASKYETLLLFLLPVR